MKTPCPLPLPVVQNTACKSTGSAQALSTKILLKQVFLHYQSHPHYLLIVQNLMVWLCVVLTSACSQLPSQNSMAPAKSEALSQQLQAQAYAAQQHMISTGNSVQQSTLAGSKVHIDQVATLAQKKNVTKYAQQAWIGKRTIALPHDAQLPALFSEHISIQFNDRPYGSPISLNLVAERLSRIAGLAIRLSPDVNEVTPATTSFAKSSTGIHQNPSNLALTSDHIPILEPGTALEISPETKAELQKNNFLSAISSSKKGQAKTVVSYKQTSPIQDTSPTDYSPSIKPHQMQWQGSLQGYLDHITNQLNLSWRYSQGTVVIERFVTESFEIASFGGSQEYQMGLSGGNQGGGGFGSSSAKLDVQENGKNAVFESLKKSLDAIITPSGGSVSLNEASGRITLHAPKDVIAKAREIIQAEDRQLKRQAHIQLDIYSVSQQNNQQLGVDWSVPISDLAKTWSASIGSPISSLSSNSAGLAYTLLKDIPAASENSVQNTATRYGGSKAFLKALHLIGDTVQYRPVSLIAMNRQWARSTSLKVTGYVSETTPSTSSNAGSGAPGLKTASVTTGDKFLVQPAIMEDGTIILKFGISLTDLLGLFNVSAGSGDSLQTVQTPETSGTDDQGSIRLRPGEAMIITGLSRQVANQDQNKIAEPLPLILGGSQKRSYQREDFLIIVRATPL